MEMETTKEPDYSDFLKRVERTVFMDAISPHAAESVIRKALEQFGTVKSVQVIHNYLKPENQPLSALVEMNDVAEAKAVVTELSQLPLMIYGMPRPVRARHALPEMFYDRPPQPDRVVSFRWVEKNDAEFEYASKLKNLYHKHAAESLFLLEHQMDRERKLAEHQSETLKANIKKHETVQSVFSDYSVQNLYQMYNFNPASR